MRLYAVRITKEREEGWGESDTGQACYLDGGFMACQDCGTICIYDSRETAQSWADHFGGTTVALDVKEFKGYVEPD